MTLKILGAVAALLLGVWLGRPRPYTRSLDDVDRALGQGGPRQFTKRSFTPLDLLRKRQRPSERDGSFGLKDPGATDEPADERKVSIRGRRRVR